MPLLRLRSPSPLPIDLDGLLPSISNVERLPILFGNRTFPLAELFEVRDSSDLIIDGGGANLHNLGRGMTDGTIRVCGPIGRHAGSRMTGGSLVIEGHAGDWLGSEMRGGRITVHSTDHQAGAAYRGSRFGMTGGSIAITHNAGDEVGLRMRRGFIRVGGDTGSFTGAAMIAGTIDVGGKLGPRAGAGMKRGTILTRHPFEPHPGLVFACEYEPQFLKLLGDRGRVRCFRGDVLEGGRGEIWQVV